MSGSFCRHPVLAKFTALAAFLCLHFGLQATDEPKKKTLFFFIFWVGSDVLHSAVGRVKKTQEK